MYNFRLEKSEMNIFTIIHNVSNTQTHACMDTVCHGLKMIEEEDYFESL